MEFQTRNGKGECKLFATFASAFMEYERDPTVWKISFENHRFRPKTKADLWAKESEEKLCELCPEYAECKDTKTVFWVDQTLTVPDFTIFDVLDRKLTRKEIEHITALACIKECLTQEAFLKRCII